mgnify:CR=1 FL=1
MSIFEVSPGLFLWSALTFIILILLLWKVAYKPLMAMQKKRQAEIHDAIEGAERVKEEARMLLAEYKQQLADARVEAEEILERARRVGESTKAELVNEAKAQADRTLEKAREQIERETRQALADIKLQVADLALAAAEKATSRSLTAEEDVRLIREALAEVELMRPNSN